MTGYAVVKGVNNILIQMTSRIVLKLYVSSHFAINYITPKKITQHADVTNFPSKLLSNYATSTLFSFQKA